jgi:glycosyltransferase involved in cell wall biosynthesis
MRILIAGSFWQGATETAIADALLRHGHQVVRVDLGRWLGQTSVVGRSFRRLFSGWLIERWNKAILRAARQQKADLFLAVKGNYIELGTIRTLQRQSIFCANYFPDVETRQPGLPLEGLLGYDLMVTTKSFQVDWLTERMGPERVALLHHGYGPAVHRPHFDRQTRDHEWDISYIGNASPRKLAWMAVVCRAFPDKRIAVAGFGWPQLIGIGQLVGATILPAAIGEDFARLAGRSAINLAFHYGRPAGSAWEDLVSTRTFELPACQGFMLHIDNDEVRTLFTVGQEIDVFADADQLIERIGYYLPRPDERETMAMAAYARAVPAYSYHSRAADLIALVEARSSITGG